jgi:hypothetical protein
VPRSGVSSKERARRRPVLMLHAGLDLSRRRLDYCLLDEQGERVEIAAAPPDRDGLRGLVDGVARRYGAVAVRAAIESMNGARARRRNHAGRGGVDPRLCLRSVPGGQPSDRPGADCRPWRPPCGSARSSGRAFPRPTPSTATGSTSKRAFARSPPSRGRAAVRRATQPAVAPWTDRRRRPSAPRDVRGHRPEHRCPRP